MSLYGRAYEKKFRTSFYMRHRPAFGFAIGLVAAFVLADSSQANEPLIPNIHERIRFHGKGDYDVYKALQSSASESGLTCWPTIEDYRHKHVLGHGSQVIKHPTSMQCRIGGPPPASMVNARTSDRGIIDIEAYYGDHVSEIDQVVSKINYMTKKDPLCRIEGFQTFP